LRGLGPEISRELGRRIVLKYMPRFVYVLDKSLGRASRLEQVLDEIDRQTKAPDVETGPDA
jgi:ribosome-binding factor A